MFHMFWEKLRGKTPCGWGGDVAVYAVTEIYVYRCKNVQRAAHTQWRGQGGRGNGGKKGRWGVKKWRSQKLTSNWANVLQELYNNDIQFPLWFSWSYQNCSSATAPNRLKTVTSFTVTSFTVTSSLGPPSPGMAAPVLRVNKRIERRKNEELMYRIKKMEGRGMLTYSIPIAIFWRRFSMSIQKENNLE